MRKDYVQGGFGQDSSTSHVKELSFPTSQLVIHVINYELEIIIDRSFLEHREAKVLSKSGAGFNVKSIGEPDNVLIISVGGEDDFGLTIVNALA